MALNAVFFSFPRPFIAATAPKAMCATTSHIQRGLAPLRARVGSATHSACKHARLTRNTHPVALLDLTRRANLRIKGQELAQQRPLSSYSHRLWRADISRWTVVPCVSPTTPTQLEQITSTAGRAANSDMNQELPTPRTKDRPRSVENWRSIPKGRHSCFFWKIGAKPRIVFRPPLRFRVRI